MKRIFYSTLSVLLTAAPIVTFAQSGFSPTGGRFGTLLRNILEFANNILIPFIIGIGFLVFVYGMFLYFVVGGADEGKQKQGKSLLIYATLAFVLIIVFWGIVNLLANSTGFGGETFDRGQVRNVTL